MGRRAKPWHRASDDQWYVTHGGRKVPLGVRGKGNRAAAEKAFHRVKAGDDEAARVRAAVPLAGLADAFLAAVRRDLEPESLRWYEPKIRGFVEHVGRLTPAADVRPHHVAGWVDRPAWAPNTRARAIISVKRLFSWAVEQGHLDASPLARLRVPAIRRREHVLTASEAGAIRAASDNPEFRDLLDALRGTGCRPGEVYTLTADRVDLDAGTWRVVDKIRGKTGEKFRTVYLSPAMVALSRELLARHPEGPVFRNQYGGAWTRQAVHLRFWRLRKSEAPEHRGKFGPGCIPYGYRHLYITDALEAGIPPATVAELVGHRGLTMIMRIYNHLRDRTDHLRRSAARIAEAARPRRTPSVPRPGGASRRRGGPAADGSTGPGRRRA